MEANSSFLWDTELRPGNAGTWAGSDQLLASCFLSVPSDIREVRVRADAGFGFHPVLELLEQRPAQYAVVARLTTGLKRVLGGLRYQRLNARWNGTAHSRAAGGLCPAQDSHASLWRQRALPGGHSSGLQFGNRIPAHVPPGGMAVSDLE